MAINAWEELLGLAHDVLSGAEPIPEPGTYERDALEFDAITLYMLSVLDGSNPFECIEDVMGGRNVKVVKLTAEQSERIIDAILGGNNA